MIGAIPAYLSLSLIIEEGFPIDLLKRITSSIRDTADQARVTIVTGDTKVAEHGAVDQLFINTAGIGWIRPGVNLSGGNAKPGDKILLNGPLGDHEMAVLTQGFVRSMSNEIQTSFEIDSPPVHHDMRTLTFATGSPKSISPPESF